MERHGFDALSFVFGAALTALGVLLVAGVGQVVVTGSWIGPAIAILIGVGLLLVAPRPARPADEAVEEGA
ncbi:MAG: hypothetical protein L0221_10465 [Chloroflexi bacterium]|nr:hypothetical protein [Chloroflexota bacterium]